ncbi:hypothetical protein BG842_00515 [Haladaptatus sp. W1]|nr:hypothetical protein BG842_00515 [Haladaptatus sp. W1]
MPEDTLYFWRTIPNRCSEADIHTSILSYAEILILFYDHTEAEYENDVPQAIMILLELDEQPSVWVAMRKSVTGTGGALLGSAATTVGGFGVLVFAILPPLQQFGIITGLTIIYSFLASVFVLPSLLALWTRYLGPGDAMTTEPADKSTVDNVGATDD